MYAHSQPLCKYSRMTSVVEPSLISVDVEIRDQVQQVNTQQQAILYLSPTPGSFTYLIANMYVYFMDDGEVWQAELKAPADLHTSTSTHKADAWVTQALAALQERTPEEIAHARPVANRTTGNTVALGAQALLSQPATFPHLQTQTTLGDAQDADELFEYTLFKHAQKVKFQWGRRSGGRMQSLLVTQHNMPYQVISEIVQLLMPSRDMLQAEVYKLRGRIKLLESECGEQQAKLREQVDKLDKERDQLYITFAKILNGKKTKLIQQRKQLEQLEEKLRTGAYDVKDDDEDDASTVREDSDDDNWPMDLDEQEISSRVRRIDTATQQVLPVGGDVEAQPKRHPLIKYIQETQTAEDTPQVQKELPVDVTGDMTGDMTGGDRDASQGPAGGITASLLMADTLPLSASQLKFPHGDTRMQPPREGTQGPHERLRRPGPASQDDLNLQPQQVASSMRAAGSVPGGPDAEEETQGAGANETAAQGPVQVGGDDEDDEEMVGRVRPVKRRRRRA